MKLPLYIRKLKSLNKPYNYLLIVFFSILGCKSSQNISVKISNQKLDKFLTGFEKAVLKHNASEIMSFMDESYVKEQHDEFLAGRTDQFLNEFFCGTTLKTNDFKCLNYDSILNLKLINVVQTDDSNYKVFYNISNKHITISAAFILLNNNNTFGFVGAYG